MFKYTVREKGIRTEKENVFHLSTQRIQTQYFLNSVQHTSFVSKFIFEPDNNPSISDIKSITETSIRERQVN